MDRYTPEGRPGRAILNEAAVLQLHSVSKAFGSIEAVDSLSLDLKRGEILTLLGPSGCGKTTTLRMIIGLDRCDSGEIVYDGRVIDSARRRVHVPTHKRQMGMVFQSYAIWPHMNVFDNVAYPLRVRGVAGERLERAARQALEQVGLADMATRPATQLSGGQQQRVALARSLVFEPKILLLDEPFSNLDALLRAQMRAELKLLQRRLGVTVLLVTHDQVEALSVSDRIAVMRSGRIEQLGTPQELYREPATLHVRDFVGRMMVLMGVVEANFAGGIVVGLGDGINIVGRGGDTLDLKAGDTCQVAVRPEHGHVEDESSSVVGRQNSLGGRIEALLFIGDHYEATIGLDIGQTVLAHLQVNESWREGQRVVLSMHPQDLRAWSV